MQTHMLSNGIRICFEAADIPITYCGFAVNAGTRDELPDEQGIAHFVEHMLFKGTRKRNNTRIINRLECVGGQLDAYTTKEETFIYAAVPKAYTTRAIELLADVMFNSNFPDAEIDKERAVILDEIESYNDSPADLIYDDFEELLFPSEPIGYNILGNAEMLYRYNSKNLQRFVERCYTTNRLFFFITGHHTFNQVCHWAERFFAVPDSTRHWQRVISPRSKVVERTVCKATNQAHYMLGCRALPFTHPDRLTLVLINNLLGGPFMSCRLNMAIRERKALAYTVESSLSTYSDTGVWSIYVGCDVNDVNQCHKLVIKEIERIQKELLTLRQLRMAQQQIEGQLLIASQNIENQILAEVKYYMHTSTCPTDVELLQQIRNIDAEQIVRVAREIFGQGLCKLIYQ